MDHHCPWINNCVGSNNFIVYYIFVLTTFAYLVFVIYTLILDLFVRKYSTIDAKCVKNATTNNKYSCSKDFDLLDGESLVVFLLALFFGIAVTVLCVV